MRLLSVLMIIMLVSTLGVSCKKKDMTLEDYAKIELEVNLPDPALDEAKVKEVAGKYGYNYAQYKEMFDKVQKDPALKEKLGEMRLQEQKPENR